MTGYYVWILIAIIIVLSFVVGIILKKQYQNGDVFLNTTIIPRIGQNRTNPLATTSINLEKIGSTNGVTIQHTAFPVPTEKPIQPVSVPKEEPVSVSLPVVAPVENIPEDNSTNIVPILIPVPKEEVKQEVKKGITLAKPEELLSFDDEEVI
jgi:hypothetical protein